MALLLTLIPAIGEGAEEETTLLAAGDIAHCGYPGAISTADLLDGLFGTVLALGDLVYRTGTARSYRECYQPTWGRHKERTFPTPGNHDLKTDKGAPYYAYFGDRAGPAGRGYYAADLESGWRLISLNSNRPNDPSQLAWLKRELEASKGTCILAIMHHPTFSSGRRASKPRPLALFKALYQGKATLLLSAHDHHYERFAPQNPDGEPDPEQGVRAFVVGTGGAPVYHLGSTKPNSERVATGLWGVLELTLRPGSYAWSFQPIHGLDFEDEGKGTCVR